LGKAWRLAVLIALGCSSGEGDPPAGASGMSGRGQGETGGAGGSSGTGGLGSSGQRAMGASGRDSGGAARSGASGGQTSEVGGASGTLGASAAPSTGGSDAIGGAGGGELGGEGGEGALAGTAGTGGSKGGTGGSTSGTGGSMGGGEGGAPAVEPQPIAVAVIGASSAAGKNLPEGGYSLADSWVNRYLAHLTAARPGSTLVNLAVSGTNTFHALPTGTTNPSDQAAVDPAHNITAALATKPDVVIVAFPSQSQVEMGMADQVLANLALIVDEAAAVDVPVWVTTNQPNKNTAASIPAQLAYRDQVLATFGERALDFWTPLAADDGLAIPAYLNAYDDVHPSAEGHRVLFEQVVAANIPDAIGE
jgi:hypothetical protein